MKRKSRAGEDDEEAAEADGERGGARGGAEESGRGEEGDEPAAKRANVSSEDGEPEDAVEEGERDAPTEAEGDAAAPEKEGDAAPDANADEERPASEPPSPGAPPDDDIDGLDAMDDDIGGAAAGLGAAPGLGARKLKVSFASVVKKG